MSRLCCALALALLLAGCGKSAPELIEHAKAYAARGEKSEAIIDLKNAVSEDPESVEAHVLLGTLSGDVGELLDGEKLLHRALELGAEPEQVLPALGKVLMEMEKYREVLDEVRPSAKMSSQAQADIALLRGRAGLRLGAITDARTQFFLAMRDRGTDAKLGLAQVAAAEGDGPLASKLVEELVVAAPESAEVWLFKGDLARADGKNDDALAAYGQALKLQPSHVAGHLSKAVVLISTGSFDAARAEIDIAQKLAPALPMGYFTRALLALREKKYDDCREALQGVGAQLPQHMPSVLLSGSLFFATGELEQAQKAFQTYLTRYPGNIYARKMLVATLLRVAQPQSASYVLAPLMAQKSQDPELMSLAGQVFMQLGQVRRARYFLEQAVAAEPDNPRVRANLGMARLVGGQRQKAVGDLEAAVALKPTDTRADSYLIMALIAQNETDKALTAAQALEQKQPKEPFTHLLKGAVYLAKQDIPQARASFETALKHKPEYFPAAAALAQLDLRDKKPDAARARMESVLSYDKSNLDALLTLANMEFEAGRPSVAINWVRRAQTEHPQATQPYLMLAQAQLQSGEPKEALSAARQARDMNPADLRALEVLARAQYASGDKAAAIVSFSTLASLMPQSVGVQLQLADVLADSGSHREAMTAAKRALQIEPGNLEATATLSAAYMGNKRYSDALDLAQQTQKTNPRFGYTLEGDVLMAQQEYARAAAAYRKADAAESSGTLRIRVHTAESLAAKGPASESALVDWVDRHPQDVDPRLYLADLYTKAGKYKAAIQHYEALLRVNPRDFRVVNNLAWALQQVGDPRAIEYAHQAFQLKPTDATVADTLGWALVTQGKLYEGVQIMFKAVALQPDNPEIRFRLVQALVKAGDTARARTELKGLLASGKKFGQMEEAQSLMKRLALAP